MTLNPKNIDLTWFLAIFGCKRVNYDEMDGDRQRLPANRNCYRFSRVSWALLKLLVNNGFATKRAHLWTRNQNYCSSCCSRYYFQRLVKYFLNSKIQFVNTALLIDWWSATQINWTASLRYVSICVVCMLFCLTSRQWRILRKHLTSYFRIFGSLILLIYIPFIAWSAEKKSQMFTSVLNASLKNKNAWTSPSLTAIE